MKLAAWLLFFASLCSVRADLYKPKSHPIIAEIVLTDGRILKQVKILSDTGSKVTVFDSGHIYQIEKKLLPADLLALWPIDPVRMAQEEAQLQRDLARPRPLTIAEAARQQHIAEAIALAPKSRPQTPQEIEAARQRAEQQARAMAWSHNGLLLNGVASAYGEIYVKISNMTSGPIRFDPRELRFTAKDIEGEDFFTGVEVFNQQREDDMATLLQGQARIFHMLKANTSQVQTVHWCDHQEIYKVYSLYRLHSAVAPGDELAAQRVERAQALARGDPPLDDEVIADLRDYTSPNGERLRAK